MSRPLGYFGCDYSNPLIADIAEYYNELQDISEADQSWLLGRLGAHYWKRWCDRSPSSEAQELMERLEEISGSQLVCLIKAVGNQSATKPLGFYSCDYELPLINDVAEHYGDNLERLGEVDRCWLLGMFGDYYYANHQEEGESDEADEIRDRLYQLDRIQTDALLQALASN